VHLSIVVHRNVDVDVYIYIEAEGVDHIVLVNRANLDELAKPLCRYICN